MLDLEFITEITLENWKRNRRDIQEIQTGRNEGNSLHIKTVCKYVSQTHADNVKGQPLQNIDTVLYIYPKYFQLYRYLHAHYLPTLSYNSFAIRLDSDVNVPDRPKVLVCYIVFLHALDGTICRSAGNSRREIGKSWSPARRRPLRLNSLIK